ncbi:lipoprotein LpqV [Rhodococcus sp. JT-3]|uniref:lipoprotein LpqV n=1 Tax=Rhodococcus sp. JT-3 TaxID=1973213 RepID=UPI001303E3B2|nr:lipoprotein LpqV [Rhodococcus sp. JT-3]
MKRIMLALTIPAALILSGCASSEPEAGSTSPATTTLNVLDGLALPTESSTPKVTSAPQATATKPASPDIYGVTPDGLTTAVNVPILASAAEMAQGCTEAKSALDTFGGDVEVVLALMQATAADSTEGVTITSGEDSWASATPPEQAAIIAALHAAAAGEC